MELRCVGGPLDGTTITISEGVSRVDLFYDRARFGKRMAYHKTRPTDTDWRAEYDPDWFIKNLPEPVAPPHVLEWHERDWVSPEVAMIRGAYLEAEARHR